jgi:short-subunit dehydrogenase
MRILLSAYACEPGRGSEPGVGWHWATELARLGHEVAVITRSNNRPVNRIRHWRSRQSAACDFYYYDLPSWSKWWKRAETVASISIIGCGSAEHITWPGNLHAECNSIWFTT